jgi:hypothetical protein
VAEVVPPTAEPMVGAPGTALLGVTDDEEVENEPVPTAFIAATVNVYASAFVRLVTVQLVDVLEVDEGQASVVGVEVVTFSAFTV